MKPNLKAPGTKLLKPKHYELLSNSAVKLNSRRFREGSPDWLVAETETMRQVGFPNSPSHRRNLVDTAPTLQSYGQFT
jgi:hypothetical protein